MNNACPECGAIYAVAEKDVGRRISCKKCNASLIVTELGLEHDGPDAGSLKKHDAPERDRERSRDRDDSGRRRRNRDDDADDRPRKPKGPGFSERLNKLKSIVDTGTWLYGIGLFLTIYSFYSPQLDIANIMAREAYLKEAEIEDTADERDVNSKNEGKPSDDDKKAREKRHKEFEKKKPRLQEDVNSAQASALRAQWLNSYIRIIGLSLLAIGSIVYLVGEQPQTRRILGAITIGFILLHVVAGGANLRVHTGDFDRMTPSGKVGG